MESNPCRNLPGRQLANPGRVAQAAQTLPRELLFPFGMWRLHLPAFPQWKERGFGVSARTPGLFQRLLLFSRKFQLERSCLAQFGLQESQRCHPWLQSLLSSIEPSIS